MTVIDFSWVLLIFPVFNSPGGSPGRAIVLSLASALALALVLAAALAFYVKVFYVMGKALSGELSCPCDRSCFSISTSCSGVYAAHKS